MRFDINCSRYVFKNKALLYKNQKPEAYDLSELHISDGGKKCCFFKYSTFKIHLFHTMLEINVLDTVASINISINISHGVNTDTVL